MKKIVISVLAITAFSFVSCEDEDAVVNEFAGKWIPLKTVINGEEHPYAGHASCGQDFMLLNEYLSFEMKDFQDMEVFNPETNQIESVCTEQNFTGSYRILNNQITFYGSNLFSGGEISLNNDQLHIKTFTDLENDGNTDEIIYVYRK